METPSNHDVQVVNLNPHYRGRVRSGCLTCRGKKVKCDEQRPICKRCTRLKRECIYKTKAVPRPGTESPSRQPVETPPPVHHRGRIRSSPSGHSEQSESLGRRSLDERSPIQQISPGESTILLPDIHELNQTQLGSMAGCSPLSLMTSQDIYLCTTIDWLTATESLRTLSYSYFLDEVDFPLVTPFDALNWARLKTYAVDLAARHDTVAATLSAVQLLFRAQSCSLPTKRAIAQYKIAKEMFEQTLPGNAVDENGVDIVMINVFLISLFSTILLDDDIVSLLRQSSGPLVDTLEVWSRSGRKTPVVSRIAAWLKIMHAAARRGGNQGILSAKVSELLADQDRDLPSLSPLIPNDFALVAVHEAASAPIFQFYRDVQGVSSQIANLSHYHRSRTLPTDQEEVVALMAALGAKMDAIWSSRPALLRCGPDEIRAQCAASTAESLISLIAISLAAYYAEQVEMSRTLSDPLVVTAEAQDAMRQIRVLVDGDGSTAPHGTLNPGFLRPLFLCAIESLEPEDAGWAVERMKAIRNPICRSDFFASYAEALEEAQRVMKRRVTTRWFCYEKYGVRPPFL